MHASAFIRSVAQRLQCDERRAEGLVFVVFQELQAWLTRDEAAHVTAQLPTPLKHLWAGQDRPGGPVERRHLAEFIGHVRQWAGLPSDAESERAVVAVFAELQRLLGSGRQLKGEAWDIFSQLPKDLKRLWLASAAAL